MTVDSPKPLHHWLFLWRACLRVGLVEDEGCTDTLYMHLEE
jgi:hypothetical protein